MTTNQWHFAKDGQVKGPYDDEQFKALCESGAINAATYVWRPHYPDWVRLAESDFRYKTMVAPPRVAPRPAPSAGAAYHAAADSSPYGAAHSAAYNDDYASNTSDYEVEDLSLLQYYVRALTKKYVTFRGRARRKEYWGFILFNILAIVVFAVIGASIDLAIGNIGSSGRAEPLVLTILLAIYALGTLLPSLAILARRLHDINISAWFILLHFIPYVGGIIILIMTVLSSYPGRNKHGPSPVIPKGQQLNYA
jgi:uncharacterized membrane protein YhaH (DUF805 family)